MNIDKTVAGAEADVSRACVPRRCRIGGLASRTRRFDPCDAAEARGFFRSTEPGRIAQNPPLPIQEPVLETSCGFDSRPGHHVSSSRSALMDDAPVPFIPPETDAELLAQCDVTAFRATGPGGQGVNTTDSAVRMKHRPTGVTVVCRRERSQHMNRVECVRRLRAKLVAMAQTPTERRPTRTPPRARRARLATKARTAGVKRLRKRPIADDD
jgi:hypothetical protein